MISRPKEVWFPSQQREIVKGINTIGDYQKLHGALFSPQSTEFFRDEVDNIPRLQGVNTLRLLSLHGLLTAQVGYESSMGLVERHKKKRFEKNRYALEHLVASTVYMANSNAAYAKKKEAWKEALKGNYEAVVGVNNFYIKGSNGEGDPLVSLDEMVTESNRRFRSPKPIFIPDVELSTRLAALGFTSYEADRIQGEEFLQDVYPRFAEIVMDLLDPEVLVVESNLRNIILTSPPAMTQGRLFELE